MTNDGELKIGDQLQWNERTLFGQQHLKAGVVGTVTKVYRMLDDGPQGRIDVQFGDDTHIGIAPHHFVRVDKS